MANQYHNNKLYTSIMGIVVIMRTIRFLFAPTLPKKETESTNRTKKKINRKISLLKLLNLIN